MGFGFRIFFINDRDEIKRISHTSFERIFNRAPKEVHLEYKNTRIRYAEVILEIENRKPVSIARIVYGYLKFDSKGRVDKEFHDEEQRVAIGMISLPLPGESSNVVHATDRFAQKAFKDNFSWIPSFELEQSIIKAAFE
ncbi:MAG: hypothetical protein SRB2_00239 [Desulfobacteraceae bacterium Eth-SRB2]|nr:MAG: hypothetical protein SRB2_00239 [Desulfobacteraceae bacterium Eth-SRB2]